MNASGVPAHALMKGIGRTVRHRLIDLFAPKLLFKDYNRMLQAYGISLESVPRSFTLYLKAKRARSLVGAEIGVAKGENALSMLQELNISRLYLIDPYFEVVADYNAAVHKLDRYAEKTKFIKLTSDQAVNMIPEKLDFAYIDGDHSYEFVRKDIMHYQRLLKPNGVIGGHDYSPAKGVVDAVDECARKLCWNLTVRFPDWWLENWSRTIVSLENFRNVLSDNVCCK